MFSPGLLNDFVCCWCIQVVFDSLYFETSKQNIKFNLEASPNDCDDEKETASFIHSNWKQSLTIRIHQEFKSEWTWEMLWLAGFSLLDWMFLITKFSIPRFRIFTERYSHPEINFLIFPKTSLLNLPSEVLHWIILTLIFVAVPSVSVSPSSVTNEWNLISQERFSISLSCCDLTIGILPLSNLLFYYQDRT